MIRKLIKIIKTITDNRFFPVVLIAGLSVFTFASILRPGYFPMHDDLQVFRLLEMDKCIKDGQIPCRWVPDAGFGYGYPLFNYYPPFPYYLGEIFHLVGLGVGFFDTVKILYALSLLSSGVFMYLLAKEFFGKTAGFISAVLYLFAPYHALDLYVRGALNEFFALAIIPLVFWSVAKFIREEKFWQIILTAVSFGLLFLSHNIMTMIFSPILAVWAGLLFLFKEKKDIKIFLKLGLAALWGLGLAAFFFLPVLLEKQYAHTETMFIGYFNYLAHFADLKQMFLSTYWGFGGSTWGPGDEMSFQIGYFHWLLAFASFIFAAVTFKKNKLLSSMVFLGFIFGMGAAFLAHSKSSFIWEKVNFLAYLQFPWRLVGVTTFGFSLAGGFLVYLVEKTRIKSFLIFFLAAFIIAINFSYFQPGKWFPNVTEREKFSGPLWDLQVTGGIFDYLPIYAKYPPAGPPSGPYELTDGKAEITSLSKGTNWISFRAKTENGAKIRLSQYDFPGWTVKIDGKKIVHTHEDELGRINFVLPAGDHAVSAKLEDTLVRKTANLISLFSWILVAAVFLRKHLYAVKG